MSGGERVEIPPALQAAFELFLKEFDTHLAHFRKLAEKLASPPAADFEPDRKSVEHRCHLIRGSAGFFKLTELKDLAASGEKEFRSMAASDYREKAPEQLSHLISELESHVARLRS
jgi:HPt (histidine-containing phosphotransfer) domain-containing protein